MAERNKINYCKWCGAKTTHEPIQIAQTPILEFLEDKIDKLGRDKVWGENSDWSILDNHPEVEAELLVYDEMLNNISYKYLCEKCVQEDNRLYTKYYEQDDNFDFIDDEDIQ